MSIDLSSMSGAFADVSANERKEIVAAIRRAETLEAFYRQADEMATYIAGLEARILMQSVEDKPLADSVSKLAGMANHVRDQLSSRLDDYRHTLLDTPRVGGFVGSFVQKLKLSRMGDTDAIRDLSALRDLAGLELPKASQAMGALYLRSTTHEERESATQAEPRLEQAFALEDRIAHAARDRLGSSAYQVFMSRIRGNIARDLDDNRALPSPTSVDALINARP